MKFLLPFILLFTACTQESNNLSTADLFSSLQKCKINADCLKKLPNVVCFEGRCLCQPGYFKNFTTHQCLRKESAKLFTSCNDTNQCLKGQKHTSCQRKLCLCEHKYRSYVVNETYTICRSKGLYTSLQKCRINADCLKKLPNTVCFEGLCVCQPGYFENYITHQCLRKESAKLFTTCNDTNQCLKGQKHSSCQRKICLCEHKYRGYVVNATYTICRPKDVTRKVIGDFCTNNFDCSRSVHYSQCHKHLCVCAEGFHWIKENNECSLNKRFKEIRLGQHCNRSIQCYLGTRHSICRHNNCTCKSGYIADIKISRCYLPTSRPKKLGENCRLSDDCLRTTNHSWCFNNICACKEARIGVRYNKTLICVLSPSAELMSSCVNSEQCQTVEPNSYCNGNICTCTPGFHFYFSKHLRKFICNKSGLYGDDCTNSSECKNRNSECKDSRCICKKGFIRRINHCVEESQRRLYEPCVNSSQCSSGTIGSICSLNQCACPPRYFPKSVEIGIVCSTKVYPGERCMKYDDCFDSNCINNKCECVGGSALKGTHCIYKPEQIQGKITLLYSILSLLIVLTIFSGCLVYFLRLQKKFEN